MTDIRQPLLPYDIIIPQTPEQMPTQPLLAICRTVKLCVNVAKHLSGPPGAAAGGSGRSLSETRRARPPGPRCASAGSCIEREAVVEGKGVGGGGGGGGCLRSPEPFDVTPPDPQSNAARQGSNLRVPRVPSRVQSPSTSHPQIPRATQRDRGQTFVCHECPPESRALRRHTPRSPEQRSATGVKPSCATSALQSPEPFDVTPPDPQSNAARQGSNLRVPRVPSRVQSPSTSHPQIPRATQRDRGQTFVCHECPPESRALRRHTPRSPEQRSATGVKPSCATSALQSPEPFDVTPPDPQSNAARQGSNLRVPRVPSRVQSPSTSHPQIPRATQRDRGQTFVCHECPPESRALRRHTPRSPEQRSATGVKPSCATSALQSPEPFDVTPPDPQSNAARQGSNLRVPRVPPESRALRLHTPRSPEQRSATGVKPSCATSALQSPEPFDVTPPDPQSNAARQGSNLRVPRVPPESRALRRHTPRSPEQRSATGVKPSCATSALQSPEPFDVTPPDPQSNAARQGSNLRVPRVPPESRALRRHTPRSPEQRSAKGVKPSCATSALQSPEPFDVTPPDPQSNAARKGSSLRVPRVPPESRALRRHTPRSPEQRSAKGVKPSCATSASRVQSPSTSHPQIPRATQRERGQTFVCHECLQSPEPFDVTPPDPQSNAARKGSNLRVPSASRVQSPSTSHPQIPRATQRERGQTFVCHECLQSPEPFDFTPPDPQSNAARKGSNLCCHECPPESRALRRHTPQNQRRRGPFGAAKRNKEAVKQGSKQTASSQ